MADKEVSPRDSRQERQVMVFSVCRVNGDTELKIWM